MAVQIKYLIVTILLPIIGFFIVSVAFGFMFTSGESGNAFLKLIAISLLALCLSLPYFTVKLFNIMWWYPAATLAAPGCIWFIVEMFSPNTHPQILLLPIFIIMLFGLPSGMLGFKHRQGKHA